MSAFKPRDAVVVRRLILDLSSKDEKKKLTQKIACSLSGVEQRGRCLFVGSDEGPGFERLQRTGKRTYGSGPDQLPNGPVNAALHDHG